MSRKFSVSEISKILGMSRKNFIVLAENEKFNFIVIKRGKRTSYFFDPVKTERYIKKYEKVKNI